MSVREKKGKAERDVVRRIASVRRVAKVVKGGKRFGFSALVIVGDGKGSVGYGTGKAREVSDAIKKASDQAAKVMQRIPLREGRTPHQDMVSTYGAGRVCVRSAPRGTGVIAGGAMRALFEAAGVQDVVGKIIGSSNPHNVLKATLKALREVQSPRMVANKRGKRVAELFGRARSSDAGQERE